MTRFKIKNLKILSCCLSIWFTLFNCLHLVRCSEFPERECCDLTTTSTVGPLPVPPAAQPTDKSISATTAVQTISVGRSGSNIKVASAILNCILARQLCFEDPSCSAILEIIPRVCGPIPVSCSTVTVTKCQAALRTLQAFQFFRPTCLCKEPGMDPDCNHFRDFLFDHPCGFVLKKAEKDPYPVDALPTCNHALSVCQQERKCLKLFEDFKAHCKVRDNKCKMENRNACHDSWTNLRLSPMFGCICPNNHMKKRCDRIFNIVNHNPCVDRWIFLPNGLPADFKQRKQKQTTTSSNLIRSQNMETNRDDENETHSQDDEDDDEYEDEDDYDDRVRAEIYSNYPHYLHPPSWGLNNPLVLASHSPHTYDDDDVVVEVSRKKSGSKTGHGGTKENLQMAKKVEKETIPHIEDLEQSVDDVVVVDTSSNNFIGEKAPSASGQHNYYEHNEIATIIPSKAQAPHLHSSNKHHKTINTSTKEHSIYDFDDLNTGNAYNHRTYPGETMDERVRIMGMDEKLHQKIFEDNLALIDTPLIATIAPNAYYGSGLNIYQGISTYPFNISEFHQRHMAAAAAAAGNTGNESALDIIDTGIGIDNGNSKGNGNGGVYYQSGQDVDADLSTEIIKQVFQSTCHTALDSCREDSSCSSSLKPMLLHCEMHRCNRNSCMTSLQAFYKASNEDLNLDIAFCLCKKTTNRHDMCMSAQEQLHPVCAQRPPDSNQANSNGIFYHPPPACHVIAETCKAERECRLKLEYYEQACAVDSVTKKCAGRASGCRTAMIGILGTMLRTSCECQGTDPQHIYKCVGWRRLLWMNPCVVEAQKDFHMKRLAELGYLTTTSTTSSTTSTTTTTTIRPPPQSMRPTTSTTTTSVQPKQTSRKTHSFKEFKAKEKSEQSSMEHNYIEQPDSIPLHSGNDGKGNSGNNDNRHSNGNSNKNGNNKGNGNGIRHASFDKNGIASSKHIIHTESSANGNSKIHIVSATGNDDEDSHTDFDDQLTYVEHVETTEHTNNVLTESTTTTTTTMATTTTTQAPRNCVVQRPKQADQLIREGSSKRIYSTDDAECSELCSCGDLLQLTCHVLCLPFAPCRTALAFYSHASPAYQAFRGRCVCYSGRFVCMKPPLSEYTLPGGVFLLLGYSPDDEAMLRKHTNLGVQDSVRALQQYVLAHVNNQTQCTLTLFNMTDENLIVAARLPNDAKLTGLDLLRKERDECTSILKTISHHVNSEHYEMQSHRLLSIFKMSAVEVIWPESSKASHNLPITSKLWQLFLSYCIGVLFVNLSMNRVNRLSTMT